jgi:NOT2 / NOT3 / NOT5 family
LQLLKGCRTYTAYLIVCSDCDAWRAGDERQLQAAAELHRRGWFWHKALQQWLKRTGNVRSVQTSAGAPAEIGTFDYWDTAAWTEKQTEADFVLDQNLVEKAPVVQESAAGAAPAPR